jgi:predicted phage-related endonuclease
LAGELQPQEDNDILERGRKLEPVIAGMFAANHEEFSVIEHGIVEDEKYPFLIGSPDRLLLDNGEPISGLEIKTADATKMNEWGQEDSDEIPVEYLIQCQWYAGLLGLPDWHIAVGFVKPGSRKIFSYKEYHITNNITRYEAMREMAIAFWTNHVVPRVPPEITEPDAATILYYKTKYRVPEKEIFSDDNLEEKIKTVMFWQNTMKEAERGFELAKTRLIAEMGDAEIILDRDTKKKLISFRGYETSTTDYKGLIAELGIGDELLAKYKKTTQARRFTIGKQ